MPYIVYFMYTIPHTRGDYPGNCSPMAVNNILLKYTKDNDIVLDQFLGSDTTAIEPYF